MSSRVDDVISAARDALNRYFGTVAGASLLQHLHFSLGISLTQIETGCLHYTLDSFESLELEVSAVA